MMLISFIPSYFSFQSLNLQDLRRIQFYWVIFLFYFRVNSKNLESMILKLLFKREFALIIIIRFVSIHFGDLNCDRNSIKYVYSHKTKSSKFEIMMVIIRNSQRGQFEYCGLFWYVIFVWGRLNSVNNFFWYPQIFGASTVKWQVLYRFG